MIDLLPGEIGEGMDAIPELKGRYGGKALSLGLVRHVNTAPNAKVYLVVFDKVAALPRFFVKVARFDSGASFLKRTHDNLVWIRNCPELKKMYSSFPYPVFYKLINGHHVQAESYVDGESMQNFLRCSNSGASFEKAVNWLMDFHRNTGKRVVLNEELIEILFLRPLQSVRIMVGNNSKFGPFLDEIESRSKGLIGRETFLVLTHNNFSLKNIKINDGLIRVIDWENARYPGLPLLDLIHLFFSYHLLKNGRKFVQALRLIYGGRLGKELSGYLPRYAQAFDLDAEYIRLLSVQFLFFKLINIHSYRRELLSALKEIANA